MCKIVLAPDCTVCSLLGMNSQILNQVTELLHSNGINPTKELVFSTCLKTLFDAGVDTRTAFDFVLGDGRFDQFAGDLHAALNAR